MIIKKVLVSMEIQKLKLRDGIPFPIKQAHSFEHKDWYTNFKAPFARIKTLIESGGATTIPSKEWIKSLSHIHSTYRVQDFLQHLKENKSLPPVEIRLNHKDVEGYVLIDGRHRCWAHILNGDTHVRAYLEKWIQDAEEHYGII